MDIVSLFFLAFLSGIAITFIFELILKTNKKLRDRYYRRHEILFGYHVHHSTVGLLLVALGMVALVAHHATVAVDAAGIGVGIIAMHTISSKRFVFIEKENFSK